MKKSTSPTVFFTLLTLLFSTVSHAQNCTQFLDDRGAQRIWQKPTRSPQEIEQVLVATSSGKTHAQDIFQLALSHLKTLLSFYKPNTWDKGTISKKLDGAERNPLMTLGIDLDFAAGLVNVKGVLPIPMTWCGIISRDSPLEGRRISFDLRRASGDFAGVVDGMRVDFKIRPSARSRNDVILTSSISILTGRNFDNHGEDAAMLLRHQIFPLKDALHTMYTRTRNNLELREHRERALEDAVATTE